MAPVSLIITTYNWPAALQAVLTSINYQIEKPSELIIADDGSTIETSRVIEKYAHKSPLSVQHIRQEDKGFRAAMIRNKAIAASKGDYIVIVDGDMILHPDFLKDHLSFARQGTFVQGVRAKLSIEGTSRTLRVGEYRFKVLDKRLKSKRYGFRNSILSNLFSGKVFINRIKGLQTCNMAFFRDDCISVNGFNEDFIGWGREDSEFGARLINNGVTRRNLRFSAVAYHLHHEGQSRVMLERNNLIYQRTVTERLTWCENGIDKYLVTTI